MGMAYLISLCSEPRNRFLWGPKSILYRQDSLCNFPVPLFEDGLSVPLRFLHCLTRITTAYII